MSLLTIKYVQEKLAQSPILDASVGFDRKEESGNVVRDWRIYTNTIPTGVDAYPYIAILFDGVEPQYETKDGGADYDNDTLVVACVGKRLAETVAMGDEVRRVFTRCDGEEWQSDDDREQSLHVLQSLITGQSLEYIDEISAHDAEVRIELKTIDKSFF